MSQNIFYSAASAGGASGTSANSAPSATVLNNGGKGKEAGEPRYIVNPLFVSENSFKELKNPRLHNRTSLPEGALFIPADLVKKTKKYRVTGNSSEGPGPNTITRDRLVAARLAAEPSTPPPTNKGKGRYVSPPPAPSRRPAAKRNEGMEAQARRLQQQIDNIYTQRNELYMDIEALKKRKEECLVMSRGNSWARKPRAAQNSPDMFGPRIPSDATDGGERSEYILQDAAMIADWRKRSKNLGVPHVQINDPNSFASRVNTGVSVPGRLFSPKKTNSSPELTPAEYRKRHNQWVAKERKRGEGSKSQGRGARARIERDGLVSRRAEKKRKEGKTGGTEEAPVWLRVPENAERQLSEESVNSQFIIDNKENIFMMNGKQYVLVEKDRKFRRDIAAKSADVPVTQSPLRKFAKEMFRQKRADKPAYLIDEVDHDSMSDEEYGIYLNATSSEELEEDEIVQIFIKGSKDSKRKGDKTVSKSDAKYPLTHEARYPIWNTKGFCYMSAFKVRALQAFNWPKNPFLSDLVKISRDFRKDGRFYLTEPSKNQLHLSRTEPSMKVIMGSTYVGSGDWEYLELMAKEKPKARIGDKDRIDEVPKFDGTNWPDFSFRMQAYLESKDLWYVMTKDSEPPKKKTSVGEEEIAESSKGKKKVDADGEITAVWLAWNDDNVKAKGTISLKIQSSMRNLVKDKAYETWEALKTKYDSPGSAGVFKIFKQLHRFQFSGTRNPAHEVNEFINIIDELKKHEFPIPDAMQVMFLLNAFPKEWHVLATNVTVGLLLKEAKPQGIYPLIQAEWERINATSGGSRAAFVAKSNIKHKPQGQNPQWQGFRPAQSSQPRQQQPQRPWKKVKQGQANQQPQPYHWGAQQQRPQKPNPNQQQIGPKHGERVKNRQNKKFAKAMRREQAAAEQQPNMPHMANMALLADTAERELHLQTKLRQEGLTDEQSIIVKTELMDLEESHLGLLPPMELSKVSTALARQLKWGDTWTSTVGWADAEKHAINHRSQRFNRREIASEFSYNAKPQAGCDGEDKNHPMATLWDGSFTWEGPIDNDVEKPWHSDEKPSPKRKRVTSPTPSPVSTPSPLRELMADADCMISKVSGERSTIETHADSELGDSDKENQDPNDCQVYGGPEFSGDSSKYDKKLYRHPHDERDFDEVSLGDFDDFDRFDDDYECYLDGERFDILSKPRLTTTNKSNQQLKEELWNTLDGKSILNSNIDTKVVYKRRHKMNVAARLNNSESKNKSNWLIDGGASTHITPHLDDFSEYQEYASPDKIQTASKGVTADILGEGKIYIHVNNGSQKREMMIKAVYVPNCSERLFSSGSLKQSGYIESSDKNNTKFSLNGKLIMMGYPRNANDTVHYLDTEIIHKPKHRAYTITKYDDSETWHNRMAHPSNKVLAQLSANVKGVNPISVMKHTLCDGCIKGKMHDRSYKSSESRAFEPLELIHADLMEMPINSYHGKRHVLVLLDDYSSFATIYLLRSKSETLQHVKHYASMMENQLNTKIKQFRSDRGGEFKSREFEEYLDAKGILHDKTVPYTSQQNGRAERINRTLREKSEAMRHKANITDNWWEFAMTTAAHVYNRTPLESLKWKTPYQALFKQQPNVSHLRTFGCLAWVWTPDEIRSNKLTPKAEPMTFIGYERGTKGWIFMRKDNRIFVGSHAIFNELHFPRGFVEVKRQEPSPPRRNKLDKTNWNPEDSSDDDDDNNSTHRTRIKRSKPQKHDHYKEDQGETSFIEEESQYFSPADDSDAEHTETEDHKDSGPNTPKRKISPPPKPKQKKVLIQIPEQLRRSSRIRKPVIKPDSAYGQRKPTSILRQQIDEDKKSMDPETSFWTSGSSAEEPGTTEDSESEVERIASGSGNKALKMLLSKAVEIKRDFLPITYKDVDKIRNSDPVQFKAWQSAMQDEINALNDRDVWELVDRRSINNRKPIRCRWVYSIKSDGRKRARLVAKGFSQIPGIDFEDTFSPVARYETVRILLATAALDDWELEALDVKTAFLYGSLDEKLYMEQPSGFVIKEHEGKVYRLKKALYGLKQASLAWNKAANDSLEKLGFNKLKSNAGIYILQDAGIILVIVLYVDNVLFMGNNRDSLMEKKRLFMKKWECRDLGPVSEYLGMSITRDRKNKTITIDQIKYAQKVVEQFEQTNCNDVTTPLPGGYHPQHAFIEEIWYDKFSVRKYGEPKSTPKQLQTFQSIIGSLLYLTLGTRPDITHAVIIMSQFMANPTEEHIKKALHIVKYVKSTMNAKLVYNGKGMEGLLAYTDADWAECKDTRKSVTGYLIKLAGAPVSWTTRKDRTIALSSTASEYMALSDTTKQVTWIKSLFGELGFILTEIEVYVDNQGAIFIAQADVTETRSKHIDIKHHHVREKIKDSTVKLLHVPTNEQQADILTKSLTHVKFRELRDKIGVQVSQRGSMLKL